MNDASFNPVVPCFALLDPQLRYIKVSPAYAGHFRMEAMDFIGRNYFDFPPPDRTEAGAITVVRLLDLVKTKQGFHVTASPHTFADQAEREITYWDSTFQPICDEHNKVEMVFFSSVDVTERVRNETELRKLNARLEQREQERTRASKATNRELEALCYSVSHDLRTPLRSVDGFSRVLLEDYSARLDEDGRDSLRRIRAASQRMGLLIEDLLTLSRTARAELHCAPQDLTALVQHLAENFSHTEPDRQVEWVITPGLVAHADAELLRRAMQNLLSNAWKFTSRRPDARIEVGRREVNGEPAFYVRDNGAGFDMEFADRLFGPFQRLHTVQEFPGTGIGLANVQRIIHRHGGRVWAEARVDGGATFYFTLPEQPTDT